MIVNCCVPGCMDRTSPRHRFPNPTKDKIRFERWIDLIGNSKLIGIDPMKIFKNRRVCHLHFDKNVHTSNMFISKTSLPSENLPIRIDSVPLTSCSQRKVSAENILDVREETPNQEANNQEISLTPEAGCSQTDVVLEEDIDRPRIQTPNQEVTNQEICVTPKAHCSSATVPGAMQVEMLETVDTLLYIPDCISREDDRDTVTPSSARLQKDSDNIEHENVNNFKTESVKSCRFCMKGITDGKNIFENYIDGDVPIDLAIRVCLYPIKVSCTDFLSKYTCDECLNTLSSFVKFRALVMRNDKIQRNHLGNSTPLVSKEASYQKRSLPTENEPHVLKKIKIGPRPVKTYSRSNQPKLTNPDVQEKENSKVQTNSFDSSNQLKLTNQDRENRNTSNEYAGTCQQVTKCTKIQLDNNETSPSTPILCSTTSVEVLQTKTNNKNQDAGTTPNTMILEENGKQSDSKVETSNCSQSTHDNVPFCMANGYLMEHKLLKGNLRYLKCAFAKCPAVSTQKVLMPGVFENKVSITKNHNHEKPTEIDIRKQKFISVIRRRLQTAKGASIKSIYDEVCKLDPDSAKLVPMKELMKEICNL